MQHNESRVTAPPPPEPPQEAQREPAPAQHSCGCRCVNLSTRRSLKSGCTLNGCRVWGAGFRLQGVGFRV